MKKIIQRAVCSLLYVMLLAPLFTGCDNRKEERHTFYYDEGMLALDSMHFTVGSVELSYARIPRGYWGHRMQQARALGANTIMVRVPWMLHEEQEGVFDFEGEKDIREFCELAQENGLYVWLHVGPFVDADMDFGGMPWWLLKDEKMPVRSHHKKFMDKVGRYYRALSEEIAEMQIAKGGPIIMINIEEPSDNQRTQKQYIAALADTLRAVGFDDMLFTASIKKNMILSVPDGMLATIVIDEEQNSLNHFSGIRKKDPEAPMLCGGIEFSCEHSWGGKHKLYNYNKRYMRMFEVLKGNGSVNIGFAIGGTSFGHLAGATYDDTLFIPYATSYNNGAIIAEGGVIGKEAERFAELYHNNVTQMGPRVYSPEYAPLIMPKNVKFSEHSPLNCNYGSPLYSEHPLTLEKSNVGYGAVLYEVKLNNVPQGARLRLQGVHDNAQIMLGGRLIAKVERTDTKKDILLPKVTAGDTLHILVDAYGRIADRKDYKGLIGKVMLVDEAGSEIELTGWNNYPLPSCYPADKTIFSALQPNSAGGYYRATIKCDENGDFYVYTGLWGRGEAWINGHSLGRYSAEGPQKTLYVPGCWLNKNGNNELIILDWIGIQSADVECLKSPIGVVN